jgi:hypothetical protein
MTPPPADPGGHDQGQGDGEEVHRRPRRSRPKEPPASGVRRRAGPRRSSASSTSKTPPSTAKAAAPKPPASPPERSAEPTLQGHRGAVIPLRAARAAAGAAAASAGPARTSEPEPAPRATRPQPVHPVAPPDAHDDTRAAVGIPRTVRRGAPRRRRGGIRAVFGPERVAAALVVILLAIAVPVALGVTTNRGFGRPQPTPSPGVAGSITPSVPPSTPSAPAPSASPVSPTPSASQLPPAERQMITNLTAVHGDLFADAAALQLELDRADGGRSEFLYALLGDPLQHATTASQLGRPSSIGDLRFLLNDAYTRIKAAAAIGRNSCAGCRTDQIESAGQTIQAIQALRPLNDELRALLGLGPTPS